MSLETCRVRGDLIEVFKLLNGSYTVDTDFYIFWNMIRVIEEDILLFKRRSRLDIRKCVL